jgi:regulator of protease activity HflC (stomatin/prohibitin superfamily)
MEPSFDRKAPRRGIPARTSVPCFSGSTTAPSKRDDRYRVLCICASGGAIMRILPEERGLLFSKGVFKRLLKPGNHFVSPFHKIVKYRVNEIFKPLVTPIEILLADADLAAELIIVDVPDNYIAIHKADGNIEGVLGPGKTCFWKGFRKREFLMVNLDSPASAMELDRAMLTHPEVLKYLASSAVESFQKGLLLIDRSFVRILDGGTYFFWKGSRSVSVEKVDLRQQQIEISGQEIMSRDKVPLRLNFFCHYRIVDVVRAGLEIKELDKQFHVILQLALREYIGTLSLDEILEKKEQIGSFIAETVRAQAKTLGLEVGYAGIKDVILPGEIRDIMNQVLIAEKKAQANVIMRREETASTRSLLNTAKLMEENEILARLKELEYIERISEKINQITLSGGTQILDQLKQIFVPSEIRDKARNDSH